MPTFTPETEVLQPKKSSLKDSDQWEEFTLTNAEIRDVRTGELTSLLHAHPLTPVRVTGKLAAVERQQEELLLTRTQLSKANWIEIASTSQHSWGQYEDGETVFWVEGAAGWFLIRPARSYRTIYEDMVEAANVLFFAADVHKESRKKGPDAELLFRECVEDARLKCTDIASAADLFYKHRLFLITAMFDGKEGVTWTYTPILQHLKGKFPEEAQELRERKNKTNSVREQVAAPSAASGTGPNVARSGKKGQTRKSESWWKASVLWSLVQRCLVQEIIEPEAMTVEKLAHILLKRYEFDDDTQAVAYVRLHAEHLRYMMEKKGSKNKKYDATALPIYTQLENVRLPATTVRRLSEVELRPRTIPMDDSSESEEGSSSAEGRAAKGRRRRIGKSSVLRPKSGKYSGKGASKKGKSNKFQSTTENGQNTGNTSSSRTRTGIANTAKRKMGATQTDAEPRKRGANHEQTQISHGFPSPGASEENMNSRSEGEELEDEEEEDDDTINDSKLPLRWKSPNQPTPAPALVPSLLSVPMASSAANAPGDVFICPYDGCMHKVYGASKDESQALIKEHLHRHVTNQQAQLELIMSEESRSNLPVSNLIKRIREMADMSRDVFRSDLFSPTSNAQRSGGQIA